MRDDTIAAFLDQLVSLAEELLPAGNRNVITDVGGAAEAARADEIVVAVRAEIAR